MKEMVGGCCVCSDERGWPENPLVYCDGQGCTVAVHQACYGIVTVPTGPWYCRKCESQERSARVRCELCPSRDGALKRTDNAGWAHVVCALYIPEVRFGNVTTMEPIILQLIPSERFNKVCYICSEMGKGSRATVGACMQCNKAGCRMQFHVTCAQALGLLCEEAGNYLDNVKYCGYCQHHYSKLKKTGNVKTIPPYKPVPASENLSPESSPEKDVDTSGENAAKSSQPSSSAASSKRSKSSSSNTNKTTNSSKSINSSNQKSGNIGGTSSSSTTNTNNNSSISGTLQNHQKPSHSSSSSSSSSSTNNSSNNSGSKQNSDKLSNKITSSQQNTNTSGKKTSASDLINEQSPTVQVVLTNEISEKMIIDNGANSSTNVKYSSDNKSNEVDKEINSSHVKNAAAKKRKAGSRTPTPNSNLLASENAISDKIATTTNVSTIVAPQLQNVINSSNVISSISSSPSSSSISVIGKTNSNSSSLDNRTNVEVGDKIKKIKTEHSVSSPKTSSPISTITPSVSSPIISTSDLQTPSNRPASNNSANTNVIQHPAAQSPSNNSPHNSLVVSVPLTNTLLNTGANNNSNQTTSGSVSNQTSVVTNIQTSGQSLYHQVVQDKSENIINPMVTLEPLPGNYSNVTSSDGGLKIMYEKQTNNDGHNSLNPSRQSAIATMDISNSEIPEKRASIRLRSQSIDSKTDKNTNSNSGRGKKRGSTGSSTLTVTTVNTSTTISVGSNNNGNGNGNNNTANKRSSRSQHQSPPPPSIQGAFSSITQQQQQQVIKESPPSSPGSETASSTSTRRNNKGRKTITTSTPTINSNNNSRDSKDVKIFQNGINAPHMLGNQLNPNSHMAQKMSDHLNSELEAHSIFSPDALPANSLVGPQLHSKILASARINNSNSNSNSFSMLGTNNTSGSVPQTLDQLLERQWEQGSQFLMEQAQHFDIASLLSCLHQLRAENLRLEEHVSSLLQRRDHLLAVNARLAIPLTSQQPITTTTVSSQSHPVANTHPSQSISVLNDVSSRSRSSQNTYNNTTGTIGNVVENGLPTEHMYNTQQQTRSQPSPTIRHSQTSSYIQPPTSSSLSQHVSGVLRGSSRSSSVSDSSRSASGQSHQYNTYHPGQLPAVTSQPQINIRRDNDLHHSMSTSSSKPS